MNARNTMSEPVGVGAILIAAFALLAYVSYGVFDNYPASMDEYGYLYQAEMFAKGQTHVAIPEALSVLKEQYVMHTDGKLYSKYPPGFPMILSLGLQVGLEGLVNPLIAVIGLLLLYLVAKELANAKVATVILLITAFNPYFLGYAGSYFAQPLVFTLFALAFYLLVRYEKTEDWRYLLLIGLTSGYAVMTRPLDGFVLMLSVGLFLAYKLRKRFSANFAWAVPFLVVVTAFMTYNQYLSGSFGIAAYPAFKGDFKIDHRKAALPPALRDSATQSAGEQSAEQTSLLGNIKEQYYKSKHAFYKFRVHYKNQMRRNMAALLKDYYAARLGYVIPVLAIIGIIVTKGAWRWLLLGSFVVLIGLYNVHRGTGWPAYGARYYYPVLTSTVLLAAMPMKLLFNRISNVFALGVVGVILSVQGYFGYQQFMGYAERFDFIENMLSDVKRACAPDSIVILNIPENWKELAPPFVNAKDLKRNPFIYNDRIYMSAGDDISQVQKYFPDYAVCNYRYEFLQDASD